jgi:hypothetical protein
LSEAKIQVKLNKFESLGIDSNTTYEEAYNKSLKEQEWF